MSLQKNEGKKEKKGKGRKGKKAIKGGIQHERDTSGACTPLEKMPYSILGCSSVAAGAGAADAGAQPKDDNVVDADYEVVDDDK